MDVPMWIIYLVSGTFWVFVAVSWFRRQAIAQGAQEQEPCPRCGGNGLTAKAYDVSKRSGHRVGLLRNIWLGLLCLELGGYLLWGGILAVTDLITGSNASGIQGDGVIIKIGDLVLLGGLGGFPQQIALLGLTWVGGGFAVFIGARLMAEYFRGGRETRVELTCGTCGHSYARP